MCSSLPTLYHTDTHSLCVVWLGVMQSRLSRGRSLHCRSSPLSESALICSSFLSRGNWYCFYSEWLLGGAAPIVFQLLIQGMSLLVLARIRVGVRVALLGQRRICGPSFILDSIWLECLDANGQGLLRAGASGRLVPLVGHLAVWEPLPSVSHIGSWLSRLWLFNLPKRWRWSDDRSFQ